MRLLRRRRDDAPSLSVVVPAYDVEDYLDECLESILGQSYRDVQVVVVDDGATDGTPALADAWAARDDRVTVVHQANAGLGAARNVGVRHCTGRYLAFADSDDVVAPGAYAAMVGALEASGSDLVAGSVERMRGEERSMTPLMRRNHRSDRTGLRIDDAPLMLADVFAWNKVFRRSFWDAHDLSFPTDVRYEDQPTLTRALVAADRFDVLAEPVYLWRVRDDGSSISQQRASVEDLRDRLLTKRWSTAVVRERTAPATQEVWFREVLPVDLWEYFRSVPGCSEEYWTMLRDGVREFWNEATVPFHATGALLRQRIMGWLVAQDARRDLEEFLGWLDERGGVLPEVTLDGRTVRDHPFRDRPGTPPELLR